MNVERVKYIIWAVDLKRAMRFYRDVLGGEIVRESGVMCEVVVRGATIGIHRGGEGGRTWTGLSFQVPDVVSGAREVVAGGGSLSREPEPEGSEPPHLAMCVDTEGNEFMLTRKREPQISRINTDAEPQARTANGEPGTANPERRATDFTD
jgi:lactoylglutathione lyase